MEELLERLQAIRATQKNAHYYFSSYSQHLLADVNGGELIDSQDLINEVCFLGMGEDAPDTKDVLEGATKFIPEISENGDENLANLKKLVKDTLVYIQKMDLKVVGVNNLVGGIAQDLMQLHGLLYRDGVMDDYDREFLYNESDDVEWITVKGSHIPVKEGQSKEDAAKEFIKSKEKTTQNSVFSEKDKKNANVLKDNVNKINDINLLIDKIKIEEVERKTSSGKNTYKEELIENEDVLNTVFSKEDIAKFKRYNGKIVMRGVHSSLMEKQKNYEKEKEKAARRIERNIKDDDFIKNFHKNKELSFKPIDIDEIEGAKIYKSPSWNRSQSSEYYLQVQNNGDIFYIRKSNHWGKFSTNYKFSDLIEDYADEYEKFDKNKNQNLFVEYINEKYSLGLNINDINGRLDSIVHDWSLKGGNNDLRKSQAGYIKIGNVDKNEFKIYKN